VNPPTFVYQLCSSPVGLVAPPSHRFVCMYGPRMWLCMCVCFVFFQVGACAVCLEPPSPVCVLWVVVCCLLPHGLFAHHWFMFLVSFAFVFLCGGPVSFLSFKFLSLPQPVCVCCAIAIALCCGLPLCCRDSTLLHMTLRIPAHDSLRIVYCGGYACMHTFSACEAWRNIVTIVIPINSHSALGPVM
jgi:hypothetical protein